MRVESWQTWTLAAVSRYLLKSDAQFQGTRLFRGRSQSFNTFKRGLLPSDFLLSSTLLQYSRMVLTLRMAKYEELQIYVPVASRHRVLRIWRKTRFTRHRKLRIP